MKSVAVLALAAGATAQVSVYSSLAGDIGDSIGKLQSAIRAYTGGDGSAVIASASALLTVVNSASSVGAKGEDISDLGSALQLLSPFSAVVQSVSDVIDDLVSRKTLAFQNGLGPTAEAILKQESSAAAGLASLITNKLVGTATGGRPIAQSSIIIPLTNALNSGISAFASGPAPTTGGSASKSSSSASASSSSASASSSSASASSSSSSAATTTTTTTTSSGSGGDSTTSTSTFTEAAAGLTVGGGAALIAALAYIL